MGLCGSGKSRNTVGGKINGKWEEQIIGTSECTGEENAGHRKTPLNISILAYMIPIVFVH